MKNFVPNKKDFEVGMAEFQGKPVEVTKHTGYMNKFDTAI